MSALGFDFSRPAGIISPLGWGVLLFGLAAAGWAAWNYQAAEQRHQMLEQRLAATHSSARAAGRSAAGLARAAAQHQEADVVSRLGLPWSSLISNLDRARGPDIGYLALEADGRSGQATLRAEARDADAMAAFLARLEKVDGFGNAELAEHEIRNGPGYSVVRFTIRLAWGRP